MCLLIIGVYSAHLMNNILIFLKLSNKFMFQLFIHKFGFDSLIGRKLGLFVTEMLTNRKNNLVLIYSFASASLIRSMKFDNSNPYFDCFISEVSALLMVSRILTCANLNSVSAKKGATSMDP